MKNTIRFVRQVLYFPVEFLPKIKAPYRLVRWYLKQAVVIDAPLRRYLVRGDHAI